MAISFVGAGVIWKFIYEYRGPGDEQIGLLNAIIVSFGFEPQAWITIPIWNNLFLMIIMELGAIIMIEDEIMMIIIIDHILVAILIMDMEKEDLMIIILDIMICLHIVSLVMIIIQEKVVREKDGDNDN